MQCNKTASLFDHLIGAEHEPGWNLMTNRLRCRKIDNQFKNGRLLGRQIGRLNAAQHLDQQSRCLSKDQ